MSTAAASVIRSARFRAEREADWRALETIVTKAEKKGMRALTLAEAEELASLYRQAMNSLSVARAISMDKALLVYLEALCARAYLVVYAPQESVAGTLARLLTVGIPQAARRAALPVFIGFLQGFQICETIDSPIGKHRDLKLSCQLTGSGDITAVNMAG